MYSMFLASTLTIYVGGLVMFVPDAKNKGHLTLLLLEKNTLFHHHVMPVDAHEPYLVVKAGDACLPGEDDCKETSFGGKVIGSAGEQVVRFPISGVVSLEGAKASDTMDWKAKTVAIPRDVCPKQYLRASDDLLKDWPTAARVELTGVKAVYADKDHTGTLTFKGTSCPGEKDANGLLKISDVAERVLIEIDLEKAGKFTWNQGNRAAVLNGVNANTQVSIWNLPEDSSAQHPPSHHFAAYYSSLTQKDACDCILQDPGRYALGTEPAFCPPSEAAP